MTGVRECRVKILVILEETGWGDLRGRARSLTSRDEKRR